MHFKLIIVFIDDTQTERVMEAARRAGATGATVINNARGEGIRRRKTFLGLDLETQRDVLMLVVEEHLSRHILETIDRVAKLDASSGQGIAFQLDIEDVVGVNHQIQALSKKVEDKL